MTGDPALFVAMLVAAAVVGVPAFVADIRSIKRTRKETLTSKRT